MATTIQRGYLEDPLNQWPLDAGVAETITGAQFTAVIHKTAAAGTQFSAVLDKIGPLGSQFNGLIDGTTYAVGLQALANLAKTTGAGSQFNASLVGSHPIGSQFNAVVYSVDGLATQLKGDIFSVVGKGAQFFVDINKVYFLGSQFTGEISAYSSLGSQARATPSGGKTAASQFFGSLSGVSPVGSQFEGNIIDRRKALASKFRTNTIFHQADMAYLVEDYLTTPYLSSRVLAIASAQFNAVTDFVKPVASQFHADLTKEAIGGVQFLGIINTVDALGSQFEGRITDYLKASGVQFQGRIDDLSGGAVQFEGTIVDWLGSFGAQFVGYFAKSMAAQFRAALYNTTNLRVLCEFPSRGVSGVSWTASHTAPGDYGVNNLNTDIVEHIWRTPDTVKTAITLVCDTGIPQGVYLDTLAMLNHNLTTSAQVEVTGSNAPDFSGTVKTFFVSQSIENSYWVSPELPLEGYRYWRFVINDGTNPAAFLSIGTIVFGESIILHQEQFADPIRYKKTHYSDRVETEGFTAVQNDRGIKRSLSLDFRSLNATGGNYENLQDVFQYARTNLKCLWIPTPQYPGRYAVFAKLTQLPEETHVDHGENADYVDLSIEMDEAR